MYRNVADVVFWQHDEHLDLRNTGNESNKEKRLFLQVIHSVHIIISLF